MKILFIGVYRDGTGWGNQAIEYMRALVASGADVVARSIKLNNRQMVVPEDIEALENKNLLDVDVCIQHLLPEHIEYTSKCKNIALVNVESDSVNESGWTQHLNMMDEVWVPAAFTKSVCEKSFVSAPINVVPTPINTDKLDTVYAPLDIPELEDSFVFYYIGEFGRRKNLSALLKAFHVEFAPEEPVNLLIKTSGDMNGVSKFCDEIKTGLRLYKNLNYYKREILITDYVSEDGMMKIHATGDCFVMPSYGEGWNIPAAEACALGKTPIMVDWGANLQYLTDEVGYPIRYRTSPAFGMFDTLPNLYSGFEHFAEIDIRDLGRMMRRAYENSEERKQKSMLGMSFMRECFSYKAVGDRILL